MSRSSTFERYVDQARNGRTAVWRILLGVLLIGLVWAIFSIVAFVAPAIVTTLVRGESVSALSLEAFASDPYGIALMLASFIGIWPGVWLALRLLHRRPFNTVLGAGGRLAWGDFGRALVATLIVSLLSEIAVLPIDASIERGTISLGGWLLWLAPLTALLFVQISAEELAFRGYLMQSLAARFRSPIVWGVLPAAFFTLIHWNVEASAAMHATMLLTIGAFAALATVLVHATGNLGAALGVHLGMNFCGILLVSHAGWLNGAALFVSRPLEAEGWSSIEAVYMAVVGIGSMALVWRLLVDPRSPLKLVSLASTSMAEDAGESGDEYRASG